MTYIISKIWDYIQYFVFALISVIIASDLVHPALGFVVGFFFLISAPQVLMDEDSKAFELSDKACSIIWSILSYIVIGGLLYYIFSGLHSEFLYVWAALYILHNFEIRCKCHE
jgi:uncharacterized membrane protein